MLTCSLVLLGGAALKNRVPPLYESSLSIHFDGETRGPSEVARSSTAFQPSRSNDLSRQAAEIRSLTLLTETVDSEKLVERWGSNDEAGAIGLLQERVWVEELPDGRSLRLSARDLSPALSASLASSLAERFLARKRAEAEGQSRARVARLERELSERRDGIERMESRLVAIGTDPGGSDAEMEELRRHLVGERHLLRSLEAKHQSALVDSVENQAPELAGFVALSDPGNTKKVASFWHSIPGLISLGLFCGIVVTVLTGRTRAELGILSNLVERLKLPIAGFAPKTGSSLMVSHPAPSRLTESYRDLRTKLMRLPAGDCLFLTLLPLRRREEVAEVVVNLACVLADGGKTVLVIDADFRHPQLHRFFGAANHPGLSDFLAGEMRLEETVIKARRPNLWFMPSGPLHADPCGLINGRRMGDLVWDMRSRFDFLLLVSPSIHEVSDAGALAALADYAAIVTPFRGCTLSRLRKARVALEAASAQLSAVFLTTDMEQVATSSRPASARPEQSLQQSG